MLAANASGGKPDLLEIRACSEVVDVPVRFAACPGVMPQARLQSAWSESAAGVEVVSRLDVEYAESSDGQLLGDGTTQDQHVGALLAGYANMVS